MSAEIPSSPELPPREHLDRQLAQLFPEEYDPNVDHSVMLYVEGDRKHSINVTQGAGSYDIIARKGRQRDEYTVFPDGHITQMVVRGRSGAKTLEIPADEAAVADDLSKMLEKGSKERPIIKVAKFLKRKSLDVKYTP